MSTTPHLPVISLVPLRPGVRSGHATVLDVTVSIMVPALDGVSPRPALNLGLVIDRSGSMDGSKLAAAKEAAAYIVSQLLPQDRVSVVTFDDQIEVPAPSTPVVNPAAIIHAIHPIQSRGSTALHAGWLEGGIQVGNHLLPSGMNRVILLTDGIANVGITKPEDICHDVHGLSQRGISTTTVGVGERFNEKLLEAMARSGDGHYHYIECASEIPVRFADEFTHAASTVGTKVSLGVEPQAGVRLLEVLNDLELNRSGHYRLTNLVAGREVRVVVRLDAPATWTEGTVCRFRLAWNAPTATKRQVMREELRLAAVPDSEWTSMVEDKAVVEQVALLDVARLRAAAMDELERGEVQAARSRMAAARSLLESIPPSPSVRMELESLADVELKMEHRENAAAMKAGRFRTYQRRMSRETVVTDPVYGTKGLPAFNYDWVTDRIMAGRNPLTCGDVAILRSEGITHVLDLRGSKEWAPPRFGLEAVEEMKRNGIYGLNLEVPDLTAPTPEILDAACQFLDGVLEDPRHRVYVHCRAGVERTAAVLVAHYSRHHGVSYDEALSTLRKGRPKLCPMLHQETAVRQWLKAQAPVKVDAPSGEGASTRSSAATMPADTIATHLAALEVGSPTTVANMQVFPLIGRSREPDYLTLDEALQQGTIRITELETGASVPELQLTNAGDMGVLLLDGEELVGAKQNRVLNLTILAPASKTITIPVSCVEAGRWSHRTAAFSSATHMQFARSRANKMKSVTAHMQASSGDRHSDQGEVWDDVQQRARKLGVNSPTIAMSDIFLKHAETLKSYVCSVTAVDCQVGAVFAINGAIRGFELLDCSSTFSKLFPKVLHSYALDAIDLLDEWNGEPSGVIQDAVRHFIDGAGTATASVFAATGAGNEVRISGSGLAGSALVVDGRVTHVAAFPNSVIPDKAI